ncbi:MAG: tRNA (adenosine(37)-N6)-threonylcarbamoyltransferase complex ATPase subunit type 1 TsaE [Clostridiales bacterium]|nr:tRNA (adenosine(37)-N6)-threonylcarbamoyltransferase complex ATPase subunit type 1 TsaE [Clostridiales bacterium]
MISHSAEETRNLGKKLSAHLKAGDVVLLQGDLGAGKSEFARGVARGLGITGAVPSPSFTILNAYDEGSTPLYHFDWYRIEEAQEIYDMGMEEQLGGDGIALIEWSERAQECLPEKLLEITIHTLDDETREITFIPHGDFPFQEDMIL